MKWGWAVFFAFTLAACTGSSADDGGDGGTSPTPSGTASPQPSPAAGWQNLPPLPGGPRQEHPVVELNGEIYVVGGFNQNIQVLATLEAFDPAAGTWRSTVANINVGAGDITMHHANVVVANSKIYIVGFLTGNFVDDARVLEYDPGTNAWTQKTSLTVARGASYIGAIGNTIYVAGGFNNNTEFSSYDVLADTHDDTLPPLPESLDHGVGAAVDGKFFVVSGRNGGITAVSEDVYMFDPNNAGAGWQTMAPMPTARGGTAGAVIGNEIFVLGGEGNPASGSGGVWPDIEAYDALANTWRQLPSMSDPRHGMGAVGFNGDIYVPGGGEQQAFGAVDRVDVYTPPAP